MGVMTVATVSHYSGQLILDLVNNVLETGEGNFSCLVCDNTNGDDQELYDLLSGKCRIVSMEPQVPAAWRRKARFASYAHGAALNLLFSKIETETALFVDPDCRLLLPNWDHVCQRALEGAVAVGAPYHFRKITKYHHFPSPIFIAFHTECMRELEPDWTPYLLSPFVEARDQFRRIGSIIGSRAGEFVMGSSFYLSYIASCMRRYLGNSSKDTGWRVASKARARGDQSVLFTPAVRPDQIAEPFRSNQAVLALMREFELFLWEGRPLLTHFYGNARRKKGDTDAALRRWQSLAAESTIECP